MYVYIHLLKVYQLLKHLGDNLEQFFEKKLIHCIIEINIHEYSKKI